MSAYWTTYFNGEFVGVYSSRELAKAAALNQPGWSPEMAWEVDMPDWSQAAPRSTLYFEVRRGRKVAAMRPEGLEPPTC